VTSTSPLWRQLFDQVDGAVTPRAEALVRTAEFAKGAATLVELRTLAHANVLRLSARFWHLLNLPAGTDLLKVRTQLGALDREARRLNVRLDLAEQSAQRERTGPP
jgi:hypothetical protein